MATTIGTVYLTGCNYQIKYDLVSQSVANNTSTVRLYGVLNVTNNQISWSSGKAQVWNTTSNLSTYYSKGSYTVVQETITVSHNTNGEKSITVTGSLNTSFVSGSTSGTITLPKINRYATITSAPDFNDEGNPILKYSNPAGNNVSSLQACIASADGNTIYVPYRDITKTGTSYTFNLTNAERNTLRNATPNSNTMAVKFYVKTVTGGSTFYQSVQKTLTITNANPTFTHTELETNTVVSNALGTTSASTIVQNLSKVKFTITPSAKKGSTIKKVEITHSGTTYSDTTSPYEFTITPLTNKFDVKVTDSRGNAGTGSVTKTLLNYAPVKINSFSFARPNPTSSNIIINLEAVYWNTTIGSVTNAPVVKWKMDNGSWNTIPSSDVTIDNTNHKIKVTNYTLTNQLVYTSGATFYISVNDAYSSISNNQKVTKGIPVLDLGDNEVQVNGDMLIGNTSGGDVFSLKRKIEAPHRDNTTNANITHTYENNCGHLQFLLATGKMTSNKPAGDGYILNCSWDNSGNWTGQLYIPNKSDGILQFRGCTNGTWGNWKEIQYGPQVATAYRTSALTNLPNGIVKMTSLDKNTNKLSLSSSGGITIGSGVSKVLVSGQLFLQTTATNSYVYVGIYKGENSVALGLDNCNTQFGSVSMSPILISVSEGDVITLRGLEAKTGTVRSGGNTYLTVQVVE